MTTIRRIRDADLQTRDDYVELAFADGLRVDHRRCPRLIMSRRHWREGPAGVAVCACPPGTPPAPLVRKNAARAAAQQARPSQGGRTIPTMTKETNGG